MARELIEVLAGRRQAWIEVSLGALARNLAVLRSRVGPQRRLMAVLKADAYGHGAVGVARRLEHEGIDLLGVAIPEEGYELREAGVSTPIVVLGAADPSQVQDMAHARLTPVAYSPALLDTILEEEGRLGRPLPFHLKVDTGMGRLGLLPDEVPAALARIAACRATGSVEGVFTHLSCTDDPADPHTSSQLKLFAEALDRVREAGISPAFVHAGNSGGLLHHPVSWFDTLRPGLALYGLSPSGGIPEGLTPILSLKSRVVRLKRVPSGAPLGYGHAFVARRASVIGTLAVGYADGLPRLLSGRGAVLIRGRRAPFAGRISMDLSMVDLTDVPGAQDGDEAVLIGRQSGASITADEFAGWGATIAHEVLARLGARVHRIYQETL
ncbi:MAG: alanine racemase [Candidatus Polarisedimenticolia bacterium]